MFFFLVGGGIRPMDLYKSSLLLFSAFGGNLGARREGKNWATGSLIFGLLLNVYPTFLTNISLTT